MAYGVEGIVLRGKKLVPDRIDIKIEASVGLAENVPSVTNIMLNIKDIALEVDQAKFWYERYAFPKVADQGKIHLVIDGMSVKVELTNTPNDIRRMFSLNNAAECTISSVSYTISDAKYDTAYNLLQPFLAPVLKAQIQSAVADNVTWFLQMLDQALIKRRTSIEEAKTLMERAKFQINQLGEQAGQMAGQVVDQAKQQATQLQTQAGQMVDQAKQQATQIGAQAGQMAGQVVDQAKQQATQIGAQAGLIVDQAKQQATQIGAQAGQVAGQVIDTAKQQATQIGAQAGQVAGQVIDTAKQQATQIGAQAGQVAGQVIDTAKQQATQIGAQAGQVAGQVIDTAKQQATQLGAQAGVMVEKDVKYQTMQPKSEVDTTPITPWGKEHEIDKVGVSVAGATGGVDTTPITTYGKEHEIGSTTSTTHTTKAQPVEPTSGVRQH